MSEIPARLDRLRGLMAERGLAGMLLTSPPDILWATGFLTRFWESPTRAWHVVIPATGPTVAVIPEIGRALMERCEVGEVRSWDSPGGDGVPLLDAVLLDCRGPVGLPDGPETCVRMPLADLRQLTAPLVSDDGAMRAARLIKSAADIAGIEAACAVGARAFARMPGMLEEGLGLGALFRRFQIAALEEGADWVAYLAGGSGRLGYGDVISPATDAPLREGDVVMLDTGIVVDGWFCDFDRNAVLGAPAPEVAEAASRLEEATRAGFEAVRPGVRACDVWAAMNAALDGPEAGRMGHGLGLSLTEPPSLAPWDETVLEAGMVLTLEPVAATGPGTGLVHEEVVAVTEGGARWITGPDPVLR